MSGTVNNAIMPATLLTTPLNQRGFCPGRQFCLNIVELDAFQKVYDCIANSSTLSSGFEAAEVAVLALFDICNAFLVLLMRGSLQFLDALNVALR